MSVPMDDDHEPVSLPDCTNRLGDCEVCNANESKYTCPRCEVKTCSLNCVKIHKTELECDGIRDKTLYKPRNKFTNLDLLSDYRLMEDISRSVIKYQKDKIKRSTRINVGFPYQLMKLRSAAYHRQVRLLFLPPHFVKHKINSTYYDWRQKKLYWRIEWIFFGSSGEVKFTDNRVLDSDKLGTIFAKFLSPQEPNPDLETYYSADFNGVTLLMKADKKSDKYYELDVHLSLRENLKKKIIIEFPTIYVILKHRKEEFDLIDSDEENDTVVNQREENDSLVIVN